MDELMPIERYIKISKYVYDRLFYADVEGCLKHFVGNTGHPIWIRGKVTDINLLNDEVKFVYSDGTFNYFHVSDFRPLLEPCPKEENITDIAEYFQTVSNTEYDYLNLISQGLAFDKNNFKPDEMPVQDLDEEDVKLLVEDICSRLPYKPFIIYTGNGNSNEPQVWRIVGFTHYSSDSFGEIVIDGPGPLTEVSVESNDYKLILKPIYNVIHDTKIKAELDAKLNLEYREDISDKWTEWFQLKEGARRKDPNEEEFMLSDTFTEFTKILNKAMYDYRGLLLTNRAVKYSSLIPELQEDIEQYLIADYS